jgi:F0F1-type ATP synthase gamma subunit
MAGMLRRRPRVEELHPFLQQREVKTRGILLITTDKGLAVR